jgi:iron complex transport system substrate-binding protein
LRVVSWLVFPLLLISGAACWGPAQGDSAAGAAPSLVVDRNPGGGNWRRIELHDAAGELVSQVLLPRAPQRIVSQTAASDEVLLALVDHHRIAGLSPYSNNPATSLDLAKARAVGRFVGSSAEQILAISPDLVFTAIYSAPELTRHLQTAEVPVLQLQSFNGWRDIESNIEAIGAAVGEETRTNELLEESNGRLLAVAQRRRGDPPRALAYTFGNAQAAGSTFDDVLHLAGARNVAGEAGLNGWAAIDIERIAAWNPDIVFLSSESGQEDATRNQFLAQPVLGATRLSEPGRVVVLSGALFGTVSHRYVDLVERVAAALDQIGTASNQGTTP